MFKRLRKDAEVAQSGAAARQWLTSTDDYDMTFNNHSRHPRETCDIKTSAESRDCRRLGDF